MVASTLATLAMASLPSGLSSVLPESKRMSFGSTSNMRPLRTVTLIWPASTIERNLSTSERNMAARASAIFFCFSSSSRRFCRLSMPAASCACLVGLALAVGLDLIHLLLQIGDLLVEIVDLGLKLGVVLLERILVLEGRSELGLFRLERPRGDACAAEDATGQQHYCKLDGVSHVHLLRRE